MATATPDTLLQTLVQLVTAAADEAASQPGQVGDALDQALAGAAAGAQESRGAARRRRSTSSTTSPTCSRSSSSSSIELSKLDPDHLSVGALAASNGWSRAVALTYRASHGAGRAVGHDRARADRPGNDARCDLPHRRGRRAGDVRQRTGLGVDRRERQRRVAHPVLRWRPAARADRRDRAPRSRTVPCSRSTPTRWGSRSGRRASASRCRPTRKPIWHVDGMGDERSPARAHVSLDDALGPLADVLARSSPSTRSTRRR